jgi:hypothetical protein
MPRLTATASNSVGSRDHLLRQAGISVPPSDGSRMWKTYPQRMGKGLWKTVGRLSDVIDSHGETMRDADFVTCAGLTRQSMRWRSCPQFLWIRLLKSPDHQH